MNNLKNKELFDTDYIVIDRLMSGYNDIALAAVGIVLKAERLPLNIGVGICQGSVARIIRTRFILEISTRLRRYTPSEYDSIPRSYALHPNTSFQNKIFDRKSSNFVRLQGNGSRKAGAFQ